MPMPPGDDHGDSSVDSEEMQARFCEECREDKPHFFKIMTNGSAKRLRIPPSFLEHINVSSHHAILKGPSNNIWRVEIKQICHGTIFRKGWKRFRRDHCLEFGDFLVFRYDGNMHFSVQIFDRSACEKESAFHVKNSKGNVPPTECQVGFESGKNMRAAYWASEHKKGSNGTVEKSKEQAERPLRRGIISQRRAITDEEKERVLAAASSFRSDRPYCRIVMAPSYVYFGFFMHLPTKFRNYLPSTASDLTLWDPSGKPWPVRYVCSSLYGGLSGGWVKFTLHHNIEEGDVCIFELIKEKELKVHIFRVVEEIVPLQRKRSTRNHCFVS
ncbi:B3 domain-containing protein Os11g0197600-like [Nymphaea colorata]|nr:B3 domain-containing protein Os11g0197600-like [Nymphaea colorata]